MQGRIFFGHELALRPVGRKTASFMKKSCEMNKIVSSLTEK
jgi:hypothetical protein